MDRRYILAIVYFAMIAAAGLICLIEARRHWKAWRLGTNSPDESHGFNLIFMTAVGVSVVLKTMWDLTQFLEST